MLWVLICTVHLTVCSCHARYTFQRESTLYICLNVKELLALSRRKIWSFSDCNWTWTHNHSVHKWTLNHLAKLAKWLSCVVSTNLCITFDFMFLSCHYAFQSESILYSCVNVRKLLAQSRHKIWSLKDCNWTWTYNHSVHKQTLNHLAKLAKWFSSVVSTYLYGAFDCMFLSCHICISEWIHTL